MTAAHAQLNTRTRLAAAVCALAALAFLAPAAQALTPATISYTGPPVAIPDAGSAAAVVTVPAAGLGTTIADVDFRIDGTACSTAQGSTTVGIDHSWVGDLTIALTSPGGTTVTLLDRAGGTGNSGNNFCQTLLDDDAGAPSIQSVVIAMAPFTGTWAPNGALSAFDGENPNGTWTLTAQDGALSDTGSVRAFSVIITPKASTAIAATSSADVALGGSVSATALVSGRSTPVADSVTFGLFGPDDATCAQPAVFTASAVVLDGAGHAGSPSFTPTAVGTYRWRADYSGDGFNFPSTSGCGGAGQTVMIGPPAPLATTIAGTSSPDTAQGGVLVDSAVVTGRSALSAGDTVTFRLYGPDDVTCARAPAFTSPAVAVAPGGTATSPPFRVTAPGSYRWIASYSGDARSVASATPCGQGAPAATVRAPVVCASQRQVTVRLLRRKALRRDVDGAKIIAASLTGVGGKPVKQKFTATKATIDLRGLPKGRYAIAVKIKQRGGRTFTFRRTYQTCEFPRSVTVTPN